MKKIGAIVLLILGLIGIICIVHQKNEPVVKEEILKEITTAEVENLLQEQSDIKVFVYPTDNSYERVEEILGEYMEKNNQTIYKMESSKTKGTVLEKFALGIPILLVYENGLYKASLELESEISIEKIENWFSTLVVEEEHTEKIVLDSVKKEEGKVNIYLFWGDGCPHCEAEKDFFESIEDEYGKYYNLHLFETWNNKENLELYKIFAEKMNQDAKSVPFTIIGSQVIKGYGESNKEQFIKAIETEKDKDFDIYFDRIKTN